MTFNLTATLAAIVTLQAIIITSQYLRERKRKRIHYPLLGILETFRIICFESKTSNTGKGIIPAKIWKSCQQAAMLTSHIRTDTELHRKDRNNNRRKK